LDPAEAYRHEKQPDGNWRQNPVNGGRRYGTVHFGLGANAVAKEIQIAWPSGIKQVLRDVAADRVVPVTEQ
jgi:hypothetical protein